jgi:hypothetical protein
MKDTIKEDSLGLKRLQALAWLDQSNETLERANDALKAFHWDLTKARQSRRSSSLSTLAYSACDVREEFVAQYRLVEQPEKPMNTANGDGAPDLIQETEDTTSRGEALANLMSGITLHGAQEGVSLQVAKVPSMVLASVSDAIQSEKENAAGSSAVPAGGPVGSPETKSSDGLRSRRGKAKSQHEAKSSEWTVENQGSASVLDRSDTPVVLDSMDLFGGGLAPRELKLAKEKAQEALRHYVRAANYRRQLLTVISQQQEPVEG